MDNIEFIFRVQAEMQGEDEKIMVLTIFAKTLSELEEKLLKKGYQLASIETIEIIGAR